ncbi:MAG: hypothetical protein AAF804_15475 [Bacteroidota bacterium]
MKKLWLCSLCLWGLCGSALWAQDPQIPAFPGNQAGADSLLQYLLASDLEARVEMTRALRPSREDCEQLLSDHRLASKVYKYQRFISRQPDFILGPVLAVQTAYQLWKTNAHELIDYVGEARQFPGGYRELAVYLAPELELYRFKFIEPGRKMGTAFDLLVYINGHWCMIYRPWVALI